jgi:hypothetical protein
MPNYNESTVSGTKWTRCFGGTFNNEYQGTPTIAFNEEEIIVLEGSGIVRRHVETPVNMSISVQLTNPEKEFDLLNPSTGEVIGKAKYQDIFIALHSLYMALAKERDAVNNPQPVVTPAVPDPVVVPAPDPLAPAA